MIKRAENMIIERKNLWESLHNYMERDISLFIDTRNYNLFIVVSPFTITSIAFLSILY